MIGSALARLPGGLAAAAVLPLPARAQAVPEGLGKIEHIVVIYLENRSFDNGGKMNRFAAVSDAKGYAGTPASSGCGTTPGATPWPTTSSTPPSAGRS